MEVGVKDSFKKTWGRRLTWADHLERMGDEKLPKRAGKRGEEDGNCEGYCIKRDIENVGKEWRKRATDRRN